MFNLKGACAGTALIKYSDKDVLDSFCKEQNKFYEGLILKDPTQEKFRKGWYNRSIWKP